MPQEFKFPDGFEWGSSTAAAQIETASDHNWRGIVAKDGAIFDKTADHEKRREEDINYITQFGSVYRCGVDWASLQPQPMADFDVDVRDEYIHFFRALRKKGMKIMFVIHHFTHPKWLEDMGGWTKEEVIPYYLDFVQGCIRYFGEFVDRWNTFNEPNVFVVKSYVLGDFPPFKKNLFLARKVLKHMGKAHHVAYELIKVAYPSTTVGISFNTVWFDGLNFVGKLIAKVNDWAFHTYAMKHFEKIDFFGLSYYAYMPLKPMTVSEIDQPGKLAKMGIPHDKMWGYKPEGLARFIRRFWKQYQKPIIITENGICTDDDEVRIAAIKDYLSLCHEVIREGVSLKGYIFWSTFDNFEWDLGNTYRFGLIRVDWATMERRETQAARFYADICTSNTLIIE